MPIDRSTGMPGFGRWLIGTDNPRSPRELDDRIVRHARQRAEEYAGYRESVGFKWLGDGWKTAVGVFSVAVIAVSLTIQSYNNSNQIPGPVEVSIPVSTDAPASVPELVLPAPAQDSLRDQAEALEQRAAEISARSSAADASAAGPGDAADNQNPAGPAGAAFGQRLEDFSSPVQVQPAVRESQPPTFAPAGASANSEPEVVVEEFASGNLFRSLAFAGDSQSFAAAAASSLLIASFNVVEPALLDSGIEIDASITLSEPPTISELISKASSLTTAYNAIESESVRQAAETAYAGARSSTTAVELPATLAETISVLEQWLAGR